MQIIKLQGTDKKLYELVAPLVMNPAVLKQNYNFPFRTSERFEWFIALDEGQVVGFVPLEHKSFENVINNYYIQNKNAEVLQALLVQTIASLDEDDRPLSAVCFVEDKEIFAKLDFIEEKVWTRYVKMRKKQ